MIKTLLILLSLFTILPLNAPGNPEPHSPAILKATIPLPEVKGAFDHFAFDRDHGRILLAAEDAGTVEVLDARTLSRLRTLTGFGNPHNILARPGARTLLVVDSLAAKSRLLSAQDYATVKNLPLELGANCTLYDDRKRRLYVTTGGDRVGLNRSALISVDPDTGAMQESVALPSLHLQPLAMDAASDRLFINLADKNEIAVVDRDSFRMLARWSTGPATTNSAIAFDGAGRRLYVVGETGVLAVLDSDTGRITATIRVPARADDLAFDPARHRLYIPGGDGVVGVYDVTVPDKAHEIARIPTRRDARTAILLPDASLYLVAAPATGDRAAAVLVFKTD